MIEFFAMQTVCQLALEKGSFHITYAERSSLRRQYVTTYSRNTGFQTWISSLRAIQSRLDGWISSVGQLWSEGSVQASWQTDTFVF